MFEAGNVWAYVIGAYAVTWVGVMGYAVRLYLLNRKAARYAAELGGEG